MFYRILIYHLELATWKLVNVLQDVLSMVKSSMKDRHGAPTCAQCVSVRCVIFTYIE